MLIWVWPVETRVSAAMSRTVVMKGSQPPVAMFAPVSI